VSTEVELMRQKHQHAGRQKEEVPLTSTTPLHVWFCDRVIVARD
jgi:hypothetical protein